MIKKLYNYIRPLKIPTEVKNRKGKILLHIGDLAATQCGAPVYTDGKLLNAKLFYIEHLPDELLTSNSNQKPRPEVVKQ